MIHDQCGSLPLLIAFLQTTGLRPLLKVDVIFRPFVGAATDSSFSAYALLLPLSPLLPKVYHQVDVAFQDCCGDEKRHNPRVGYCIVDVR